MTSARLHRLSLIAVLIAAACGETGAPTEPTHQTSQASQASHAPLLPPAAEHLTPLPPLPVYLPSNSEDTGRHNVLKPKPPEESSGHPEAPPLDVELLSRQERYLEAWDRHRSANPDQSPSEMEQARQQLKREVLGQ
jgi:hypothetical protein